MKKFITLGFAIVSISISGCTFNIGTNDTNATGSNTTATNTTNSAPAAAENKPPNTAAAPKKDAPEPAKKSETAPNESKSSGTRVQFANGETSTSVTKDIPANGSVEFIMNVQKGQTMGYTVGYDFNDSDVEVFLTEPGSHEISKISGPKAPQEFAVKKSGDHSLNVTNTSKKKITITLYLDVE